MNMRNKTVLLAAVCALVAAPALAQQSPMPGEGEVAPKTQGAQPAAPKAPETKGAAPAETQGAAPAGKAALSTQDFVTKAAMSGMFEVEAAKLAQQKDKQRKDKRFAKRMIKDHSKANDQLKAMVQNGKVQAQLPKTLDSEHQQKLDELKQLNGKEFDKAYDEANKSGHEEAVAMFESYSQNGDNPQLKQWASKTLPTLKKHLSMAKKL